MTFQPTTQLQRPGLLLMNGVVYAGFGSHCDHGPWQGWIFGVSTAGEVKARWVAVPSGWGGGIWQSGSGLVSDEPGTLMFATGNLGAPSTPTAGKSPPSSLGESVVRLAVQADGSLKPVDFFAPYNAKELDEHDLDFASSGISALNDQYFGTPGFKHLMVAAGKEGYVYLLNREELGGFKQGLGGGDKIVQRIGPYGGVWSRPAVWPGEGGWVYIPSSYGSGALRMYQYGLSGSGQPTLSLQATSSDSFGFSSSAAVITSDATRAGSALVWIVWTSGGSGTGAQLRAYDPVPVAGKPVLRWSAPIGTSSKFATPGVGAGRIYVGTRDGKVLGFGSPVTAPLTGPSTEFEATTIGSSSEKTITLTATTTLTVTKLTSSSSQFSRGTPSPPLPAGLSAGQTIQVPVKFTPTQTGLIGGTLTAETTQGPASFSLSGTGRAAAAQLATSPSIIAFGGVTAGSHSSGTATFRNVGSAALRINGEKLPAAPFGAKGMPAVGSEIAPGASVSVEVTFDPTSEGSFGDELSMETSGGNGGLRLSGSAGPPGVLKITSEQNEFGEVAVGKTATRSFTVSNSGGTNVTITKSKPPSGGAFAATTTLSEGTTLTPGESLTETVSFTPTTPGSTSGVWLITGNDSTGPHELTFSGTGTGTFGKTSAGASSDSFRMDRKRVSRYALSSASLVSKLSIYLAPAGPAGQQVLKGVIYADSGNAPGALLGASEQLTFTSTNSAGWYDLSFSSPLKLAAGSYWIGVITGATSNVAGFRYDSVASSRDYNVNTYTSGPSEPFGPVTTDAEQMSLYATYAPVQLSVPVHTAPPTITGTAQQGQTLTEHHGTWANEPTSYGYQWQQCDSSGNGCLPISGATAQTYVPVPGDVGHAIRVQETASNAAGPGSPATSTATASATPPAPTNSSPPTITGTAQQGQTLTEHNGSWANEPTSFTHQWLRCDGSGNSCKAISAATSQTYVPVPGDVGHAIRVEETASNAAGPGSPATSAATAAVVPPPPANISPPTITGTAQQGQTLTEHHGTWANEPTSYSYQWLQCDSLGSGCLAIAGATGQTYVPGPGDVGHKLKVQEIASNAGGSSAAATSEATATATPPVPTNTSPPTITGTAQQGQTLTEHHGTWANEPTSYSYLWLQCDGSGANCKAISGATNQTYVPVFGDVGHAIRVEETATNASGPGSPASSAATAAVVPPPPESISPPTITGSAQQGQTLTEHHGTWANEPTSYSYQWQQCDSLGSGCLAIAGATAQTYVPVAGDVGHKLKVQEIASNAGGSSAAATSEATAVVVAAPVPLILKAPTISGTAQQEKTLTEAHGEWTNGPTSFTYQWQQCNSEGNSCTPISGATAQTYSPLTADVGHRLRVQETASHEAGSSAPASSEATAVVIPPVATNVKPPTITGTAQQGQTLTEHNGEWTNSPTSFSYQWLQCDGSASNCVAIGGATKQTYVPVAGDVGHKLRVQEVATNAGGSSAPATSEAPPVVVPPVPVNQTAPTITGTAQQGQPLTEHHGTWTNEPTSYSYQWLQCDSLGNGCLPIAGAAAQTYVPLASDVGHTIEVQETANNAGGSSSPATSSPTAVVSAPPVPSNTAPPTITGTAQQGQLLTAQNGSWTNEPTSFAYQWQRCDTTGANCSPISTATAQTYTLTSADVGSTLRVQVTAANAAGSSVPSSSAPTAVVQQASATLGKTTVGASTDSFRADRKRVNRYALAGAGTLVKLSIYLAPSGTAGQQVLKGLVYADSSNAPGALLATTEQLTFKSTSSAGWYDLSFSSPVKLAAGNYWIGIITGATSSVAGFRYDSVAGSRDYNANTYTSGPTNPFGAVTVDAEQSSLYATYSPG
jgi:hypothetical protein